MCYFFLLYTVQESRDVIGKGRSLSFDLFLSVRLHAGQLTRTIEVPLFLTLFLSHLRCKGTTTSKQRVFISLDLYLCVHSRQDLINRQVEFSSLKLSCYNYSTNGQERKRKVNLSLFNVVLDHIYCT